MASDRFERFHDENPDVYDELRTLALDLKKKGRTRYSIKCLFEVVRWHRGGCRRLNNDLHAEYARVLMAREPSLAGFFETRVRRVGRG